MGTGGAGGPNSCPLADRIDCTSAGALDLEPDGQVVDFSAAQWNDMNDKWCNALGLDGGVSAFAGMSSTAAAAVDTMAGNLRLNLSVGTGQYAGGRVNFDSCVSLDPMTFDAIQFTASLTAGSLTGCVWQVQIQTQNQRPINQSPSGGMCMTTCERYPAAVNLNAPTANPTTFTVPFSSFNNPSASMIAMASQITGVQWQVNSGSAAPRTCTVELRIDNVRFVNQ
jgi:hypothetical protein